MSENYPFARFWRCALQVNPAGYHATYRGSDHGLTEAAYNQALLEQCLKLDIRVVGMADHGSVDSIDATRKVLEPAGIVVFPGFEIASNDKTHFVCLFPEGTTSQLLERYLGHLQLLAPEDGVRPSRLSSVQLIEQVADQLGGFVYAAHCTEDRGLLKQRLNHVWQLSNLRAAQIPGSVDDLKGLDDDFYRRVFLNKDKAYEREHLMAAINAKDVAKPTDLEQPGATCWIKMTRPTFSAFKVAFLDPESRVRLNSEQPVDKPSAIHSVKVSGGYLDGMHAELSGHLDTVIGGRGTGKSTLIECLRFALDLVPKGIQARKQHAEIIKENLGKDMGRVEVQLTSFAQHGKRYTVTRRVGEAPIVRDPEGQVSTLVPRDLLPDLDIYGQNEIYELAQDESSRLRLLERFLPHDQDGRALLDHVQKRLRENAEKLTKAFDDADTLHEQVNRLPKLQEQLQGYDALGLKDKLARVPLLERERQIDARVQQELKAVDTALAGLQDALPDTTFISDKALEGLPHGPQLAGMRTVLDGFVIHDRLAEPGTGPTQDGRPADADGSPSMASRPSSGPSRDRRCPTQPAVGCRQNRPADRRGIPEAAAGNRADSSASDQDVDLCAVDRNAAARSQEPAGRTVRPSTRSTAGAAKRRQEAESSTRRPAACGYPARR